MPASERSSTPRWLEQQDEIDAAAAWGEDDSPPLFDRFELLDTVGYGGYGCVFKARDPKLNRVVAIKRCMSESPCAATILLSEAQTLAQLSHPNIITIHESGKDDEDVFFVMEYVSGGSLEAFAFADEHERPWRALVPIFVGAARGVAAAHEAGVVHGDIKPANILLHEDLRPRVADFGLARIVGVPTLMPGAVGTLAYAAPEVLAGQIRNERSDQWSFFVTLWHCLEGELPFVNPDADAEWQLWSSEEAVLRAIDAWPGPSSLRVDVPESLRELLRVGLSRDPGDRFPDMHAVARELSELVVSPEPNEGYVHELVSERAPPASDWPWTSYLIGGLLFGAGVLAMWSFPHLSEAELVRHEPPPVNSSERAMFEPRTPCVADGVPIAPDTSVQTICRALTTDYQAAGHLWDEVAGARERDAATPLDWLKLGCDTASIAQTYLRVAETSDPQRAEELRAAAKGYAQVARNFLSKATVEETAEAVSQVESVIDRIIDEGHSRD